MSELNKEKFGVFVAALRKEKGLTQKELAQQLHVTDKAVSKWERALSLPDVALLSPLAEALGVTVTELLEGKRLENRSMDADETDRLVQKVIDLSAETQRRTPPFKRKAAFPFLISVLLGGAEFLLLRYLGYGWNALTADIGAYFLLSLIFGCYFCLFPWKSCLPIMTRTGSLLFTTVLSVCISPASTLTTETCPTSFRLARSGPWPPL